MMTTKMKCHPAVKDLFQSHLAANHHAGNGHHAANVRNQELRGVVVIAKNENHALLKQQIDLADSSLASHVQRLQLETAKGVEPSDLRALLQSFRIFQPGKKQLAALRFARQPKNTHDAQKIVVDVTVADDLHVAGTNQP